MNKFKAAIFDLDGVIADTACLHLAAWQRLAQTEGFEIPEDADERLKGVDRMASLGIVLERTELGRYTDEQKLELADRKNRHYQQLITQLTPQDMLPGAKALLDQLTAWSVPMALASASKNAQAVLEGLGIASQFHYIADAARITHPKPDPEIFLTAAAGLNLPPSECMGLEDAAAGITAIKRANMFALGVGDPQVLAEADLVVSSLEDFEAENFFGPQA